MSAIARGRPSYIRRNGKYAQNYCHGDKRDQQLGEMLLATVLRSSVAERLLRPHLVVQSLDSGITLHQVYTKLLGVAYRPRISRDTEVKI
ncbi:hypothetical protein ACQP2F_15925 [Actinoplanes sp. CA-030573]|uniref:hypothetical protein n=1 Tax=Actinoplanes sp. CA-030573 TaxID=3239898 RepID=UPI003D8D096B